MATKVSTNDQKTHSSRGFTIVELLIVIVVIAILAIIALVAYNGIQERALDTRIRQAASDVEKAMKIWALDHGSVLKGGSGSTVAVSNGECTNGGGGFFGSVTYTCTAEDALVSGGQLPSGFSTRLPANKYYSTASGGRLSMMLYGCGTGKYALYWTLRSPSASDITSVTDTITSCSNPANIQTTYGMRAGRIIDIS